MSSIVQLRVTDLVTDKNVEKLILLFQDRHRCHKSPTFIPVTDTGKPVHEALVSFLFSSRLDGRILVLDGSLLLGYVCEGLEEDDGPVETGDLSRLEGDDF